MWSGWKGVSGFWEKNEEVLQLQGRRTRTESDVTIIGTAEKG